MPEKPKKTTRNHLRPLTQIREDLDSSDLRSEHGPLRNAGTWPRLSGPFWPRCSRTQRPRGIYSAESIQLLPLAFPGAEEMLTELLSPVESEDPKVRLAAISRVITILPKFWRLCLA